MQLSLTALLLASLLALILAVVLRPFNKLSEFVLQLTGILQTIPSLAILGLLIPFLGIGFGPALVALVLYGLFPILQDTLVGLRSIDPTLEEAALALGLTNWQKFKKVDFPLALPMILSGVRTSGIMIIGTATLAALIGAGGLGTYILLGIDRQDNKLILIGAILSAGLAIGFSLVINLLKKLKLKQISLIVTILVILTAGSFLPQIKNKSFNQPLIIAGKLGTEPNILIQMYKLLIENQTDIKVELKENLGKTAFLYQALKSGAIDLYPEFTGTITKTLLKNPPKSSNNARLVYEQAKLGIKREDDLVYLRPMAYQNTYALAVKQDFATKYHLQTISDLQKVSSFAIAGFTLEFSQRADGNKGLQSKYQLNLKVKTMEPALRYKALERGDIQIIDVYSTDSEIRRYHLKVLQDNRQLFPPYQGAPLMRAETLKKYPALKPVLNQLAGKITTKQMQELNYQVDVLKKSPRQVAQKFLSEQGLLKY
ncbi:ABC transporter permease/substrate-binding protein [Ligilactobacillus agilis]|uniref:ABC transporter permease/substrate-binding protein n=1 Tax=Ligilactobacillus agilis TaxID=1601 RepID=A0A9Q9J6C0_9LACO|nr:ABC transporter permease/substrate-binding protein [Ligilactobacillus agilis]MBM6762329.1 ABC transporter permease/substrate-binding protein [Ligilactobacillus agilis]MBM6772885.1 ABC transporter permease/substrate-binding protein [Ligilactobacillus agilis]NJE32461.1 ABC transporter permease/substrate-binding protein [Ligilactobacillus agilis]UXC64454.1 ABC transporter permease/substrate-binding protein [Ligilactobacillus agilis]UXC66457.1 ABC transporter permease/substrate-binding protein 